MTSVPGHGQDRRPAAPAADLASILLTGPKLDEDAVEVFAEIAAARAADFGRTVDLEAE